VNPIGELLQPQDIRLDVDVSSKAELLERLADLLARHGLSRADILASLTERERLGSTGLGHGVAIPHARMKQLHAPIGAFVRTLAPVAFDAPDGRPVSSALALLVPAEATDKHLKLMANAASLFGDRAFRQQLRQSVQPSDVGTLFASWNEGCEASSDRQPQ
jgi:PTS system nitrogen regulatory IIA component